MHRPSTPSRLFLFEGKDIFLLKGDSNHYELPWQHDLSNHDVSLHTFGTYHDIACMTGYSKAPLSHPLGTWVNLKKAFSYLEPQWAEIAIKAHQIANFTQHHQFCGQCGQQTQTIHHHLERHCSACSLFFYPKLSPAIIVLIEKDHQILLARNAANTNGIYSLIAGFIEPGETAEQTVHREVYEEVGLKVKQVTYIDSQSWIYPDSLMLAFTAQYESGDIECRDGEIAQANWFTYDNLPPYPEKSQSIAKRLIDHFITTHSSI